MEYTKEYLNNAFRLLTLDLHNANEAIKRVRMLHTQSIVRFEGDSMWTCDECSHEDTCPTIEALDYIDPLVREEKMIPCKECGGQGITFGLTQEAHFCDDCYGSGNEAVRLARAEETK